jgi:S1-C subfamily serine protease
MPNTQGGDLKIKVFIYTLMSLLVACGETLSRMPETESSAKEADGRVEERVIYGEDNRVENYQASQALRALAASTVALVKKSELSNQRGFFVLGGDNFGSSYNLCSSEPFRDQTSGAFCSGSLVGPNLVMTAGHCITNSTDCANTSFVFDFALTSPSGENKSFPENSVYACSQIIKRELENSGADYALIELDRAVSGRSPLKVRRSGNVSAGDPLVVIGHPAGLPQKIAGGAVVRAVQARHFVTNLDTYGGNSGSAVFNAATFEIEGILVHRACSELVWLRT